MGIGFHYYCSFFVLFMQMFLKLPGFTDNVFTHLLAGLGAGFFAVCIGSPVDVVCPANSGLARYQVQLQYSLLTLTVLGCMPCVLPI